MKNGKHNVLEELIDSFEQKVDKNQQNNQKEKVELNLDYNGKNSYDELVKIIFDYFEESQGIQLDSISTSYLRDKLTGKQNIPPIFAVDNEMGEARFDIPGEDIKKIFSLYLAKNGYELVDLDFSDMVDFKIRANPEMKNQQDSHEEKVELNLNYSGTKSYDELKKIILGYFEESQGIQLESISTGYLRDKLVGKKNIPPIFAVDNGMGKARFDIPREDIEKIFSLYLAKNDYELVDLDFSDLVRFTYNQNVKNAGFETSSSGIAEYGESSYGNSQLIQNNLQSRIIANDTQKIKKR